MMVHFPINQIHITLGTYILLACLRGKREEKSRPDAADRMIAKVAEMRPTMHGSIIFHFANQLSLIDEVETRSVEIVRFSCSSSFI